jgi:hypothetical protein
MQQIPLLAALEGWLREEGSRLSHSASVAKLISQRIDGAKIQEKSQHSK